MSEYIIKNYVKEVKVDKLYSFAEYVMKSKKNDYFFIDGKNISSLSELIESFEVDVKIYDEQTLDNFSKSMYYVFSKVKSKQIIIIISQFNDLVVNTGISKKDFLDTFTVILKMFEENKGISDINGIKKSLDFYLCEDEVDFEDFMKYLKKIKNTKKTLTRKK